MEIEERFEPLADFVGFAQRANFGLARRIRRLIEPSGFVAETLAQTRDVVLPGRGKIEDVARFVGNTPRLDTGGRQPVRPGCSPLVQIDEVDVVQVGYCPDEACDRLFFEAWPAEWIELVGDAGAHRAERTPWKTRSVIGRQTDQPIGSVPKFDDARLFRTTEGLPPGPDPCPGLKRRRGGRSLHQSVPFRSEPRLEVAILPYSCGQHSWIMACAPDRGSRC